MLLLAQSAKRVVVQFFHATVDWSLTSKSGGDRLQTGKYWVRKGRIRPVDEWSWVAPNHIARNYRLRCCVTCAHITMNGALHFTGLHSIRVSLYRTKMRHEQKKVRSSAVTQRCNACALMLVSARLVATDMCVSPKK
jgi:hypothetical protein